MPTASSTPSSPPHGRLAARKRTASEKREAGRKPPPSKRSRRCERGGTGSEGSGCASDKAPKQLLFEEAGARGSREASHPIGSSVTSSYAGSDPETLQKIAELLAAIPTGEIAYGAKLVGMPLPNLVITETGEVIQPPYSRNRLHRMKLYAKQLREKRFGIGWEQIHRTPTWIVPGSGVQVDHPQWQSFLDDLALEAAEYLGFGSAKLVPQLHGLFLWEMGSVFRDYANEYYDPIRVGTLLIILNDDYRGGQIAVACGDKELFFDPASSQGKYFYIASHNRIKFDNLPISHGFRLGLSYDLRLETHNGKYFVEALVRRAEEVESELRDWIIGWALEIEASQRENHPLLFVLSKNYDVHDMSVKTLCAADRAKALATWSSQKEEYGEQHALQVYLVQVVAVVQNQHRRDGVQNESRYFIQWATTLDGGAVPRVKETVVDERCLLQPEAFEDGAVSDMGSTTTIIGATATTRRTRTCLMLLLCKAADMFTERSQAG
ncbi:hypothetical protein C8A03DRAFT_35391 [Achaetomium macrosporum]|uniref:Uncharacterized protein n=1 Tax=Achaetomium macrosporum TaxID=79813 RepID=A0AAN7H620_9PEZI|nr:hypothetical protein C8A03DRAFT_35391 [Achaetomium macrosporum]